MSRFCKTTSFGHTAYAKHFMSSYSHMYHEPAPMHCFKKAWLYLRHGWVWCGAIPQRFVFILASLVNLQQQHKWACWSIKFSCSMLCPDWFVLTDKAPPPINMAALICCVQATMLLLIWWVAALKHVVRRLQQQWANKNVQLRWLNMPHSHMQTCSSTARTLLPVNMHHKVSSEHWLPCRQTDHMICTDNRTWCYCPVRSFCHVWCPSGLCWKVRHQTLVVWTWKFTCKWVYCISFRGKHCKWARNVAHNQQRATASGPCSKQ